MLGKPMSYLVEYSGRSREYRQRLEMKELDSSFCNYTLRW